MRRNTVTLLKYVIVGCIMVLGGPFILRKMFGSKPPPDLYIDARNVMPGAPQDGKIPHANEPFKKIDWHDYKKIVEEEQRQGPGEQGQAVILSAEEEKKKGDLYKVNGFNAYVSDKISFHRSIKDIRHPDCKKKKYLNHLMNASVIVPFHNEHWSTLLRTAWSVLNRSPKHLIHEIILVDDYSSKEHCKQPLDDYVKEHFTNVKVVRAKKREGLIRTRLLGAKAATGQVLIFLDSHCEANVNWLPPLLDPIAEDYKTVVCPFIDVVDFDNFAYRAQDEGARGAFDWEFFYKRLPLLDEDLKHPAEPFKSPVMAGGLFAISTKWFWEMGGYDPGLDIWGGEQYELSFKIWQCGGMMVDAPCSRIGHIYRKFAPFPNPGVGDFVGRNYRRVAEVWMDEYAEYLYKRRPHYRNIDPGDLTDQKAIRDKLQCKPFKWFMKEVAFDLPKFYPPVEPPPFANGEIRSRAADLCIDTRYKGQNERFDLQPCVKDGKGGGEQQFELTWHKDIRPGKRTVCFDVSQSIKKAPVILFNCHGMGGNQRFKYNIGLYQLHAKALDGQSVGKLWNLLSCPRDYESARSVVSLFSSYMQPPFKHSLSAILKDTQQIFHVISNQCLDCDIGSHELFMNPCDKESKTQRWKVEHVHEDDVRKEWKAA